MGDDVIGAYVANAERLRDQFDQLSTERVLSAVLDHLPMPPAPVLDIGAGSGRDVAWFAARGHAVTAAEPVAAFREAIAARLPGIPVPDARLPELAGVDGRFGLVMASGVWHHLCPEDRMAGFHRIAALLLPGGRAILSLRHGPAAHQGLVFGLDPETEISRAEAAGLRVRHRAAAASVQNHNIEAGVTWTWLVLEPNEE